MRTSPRRGPIRSIGDCAAGDVVVVVLPDQEYLGEHRGQRVTLRVSYATETHAACRFAPPAWGDTEQAVARLKRSLRADSHLSVTLPREHPVIEVVEVYSPPPPTAGDQVREGKDAGDPLLGTVGARVANAVPPAPPPARRRRA